MKTQLVLLGTGTPNLNAQRYGSATAIVVADTAYLVDFGAGVMQRMVGAQQQGIEALAPAKIKYAFLTHLHSDHTVGYPDLIFSSWVMGRTEPLEVYGPRGLHGMTTALLNAYQVDIQGRINGIEALPAQGYAVNAHEITPGICYQDEHVTVTAFTVNHGVFEAFGYKFDTPAGSIVLSGDTTPVESVMTHAKGCKILVHNAYSAEGLKQRPERSQQVLRSLQTSTVEVSAITREARPGLLVLTHVERWTQSEAQMLAEVRHGYPGRVVLGSDLAVFDLAAYPPGDEEASDEQP